MPLLMKQWILHYLSCLDLSHSKQFWHLLFKTLSSIAFMLFRCLPLSASSNPLSRLSFCSFHFILILMALWELVQPFSLFTLQSQLSVTFYGVMSGPIVHELIPLLKISILEDEHHQLPFQVSHLQSSFYFTKLCQFYFQNNISRPQTIFQ